MGEFTEKAKGVANDAIGNVKQAVGKGTDNAELVAEGLAQEAKGEAQKIQGEIEGEAGDRI